MKIYANTGDQRGVSSGGGGGGGNYEVDLYANGSLVVANVATNFNNTATVNVLATSNGTQGNIAFSANGTALGVPAINTALGTMNTTTGSAYAQANAAANLVAILANGTVVLANGNVNFNNTATINVLAVANGTTGKANVSFSVNLSSVIGSGTVTNVATGLGLTGGPVTTIGTISANIANTTQQGITQLIDTVVTSDIGNAATANAVTTAWNLANTANTTANVALALGANAWILANTDFVYANGGASNVHSGNLNFNNTATVNVAVSANGTTQANITFSVNTGSVANNQIAYSNGAQLIGESNFTYNGSSNLVSVDGNVKMSNGASFFFGGYQGNNITANAHFQMGYNATANSIDIIFLG